MDAPATAAPWHLSGGVDGGTAEPEPAVARCASSCVTFPTLILRPSSQPLQEVAGDGLEFSWAIDAAPGGQPYGAHIRFQRLL